LKLGDNFFSFKVVGTISIFLEWSFIRLIQSQFRQEKCG